MVRLVASGLLALLLVAAACDSSDGGDGEGEGAGAGGEGGSAQAGSSGKGGSSLAGSSMFGGTSSGGSVTFGGTEPGIAGASNEGGAGPGTECPPECLRAYNCVYECGGPAVSNGCCECTLPAFDDITCP